MKHYCVNCAYYEPKERDGHCIAEYDLHTDPESIEDPELEHCAEWVAMKHRPEMALRSGVHDLKFMLEQKWYQQYLTPLIRDKITQIIATLERGLRK